MVCACRENIIVRFCSKGVYQMKNSQITRVNEDLENYKGTLQKDFKNN